MADNDTIYSLSTPPGRGGVAVVRVSGPDSQSSIEVLTGKSCPAPRRAVLRPLKHDDRAIDTALVLYFAAPASFTGESMAEFQIHGGRAVVAALSRALEALGCRQAEPGEFTKRAFLNGKIDLTEAEAIGDLIDAETEAQHIQALLQAGGALSRLYTEWAERLLKAHAYMEASLDFSDEDLPPDILKPVHETVASVACDIHHHLSDARRGERIRQGVRIAISGAPNVGKSTLLNALAQREVAIVSARAGTTRDILEVNLDLGGYPVTIADTAGIRETSDEIEAEGIARATRWARSADIRLLLVDSQDVDTVPDFAEGSPMIVLTKCDLPHAEISAVYDGACRISVHTGAGIPEFLRVLTCRVGELIGDMQSSPPTRERHAGYLRDALQACRRFGTTSQVDLAAEELRAAGSSLGRITGRIDAEALLDIIFREFCIGK